MRVDWCVSSWFRIKNTHSHSHGGRLPRSTRRLAGRLSGPARPLRGTRRHGSLLNTNPVEAGSMERRRGMVKNDGTADSKERRHNGNGWRGVGRLGKAGKRAAGRREGDVAGCLTRR